MVRLFAAAVLFVAVVPSLASEPGQPLDCSDVVFLEPGHSCLVILAGGPGLQVPEGVPAQFDNEGRIFRLSLEESVGRCSGGAGLNRTRLEWLDGASWRLLAYLDDRCVTSTKWDAAYPAGLTSMGSRALAFDHKNGRMILSLISACNGGDDCSAYPVGQGRYWLAQMDGFATTFDVLQTYTPATSSLSFRVPYMPEGLPAADHFDTYWGDLTNPIDFTQAHPLQCNYPASPPQVGDYLTVADPLPNPAVGTGRYYVTAVTHQGQTRYGRKASGGRLSGRDPAVLPACVTTAHGEAP